jgi:hypothetical protein
MVFGVLNHMPLQPVPVWSPHHLLSYSLYTATAAMPTLVLVTYLPQLVLHAVDHLSSTVPPLGTGALAAVVAEFPQPSAIGSVPSYGRFKDGALAAEFAAEAAVLIAGIRSPAASAAAVMSSVAGLDLMGDSSRAQGARRS